MAASDVVVRFMADTTQLTKATDDVGSKMGGLAKIAAGAFGGVALGKGIKESIDAASDLAESISKTGVVFEDAGKNIVKWSKDSAESVGLSQQAALEAAGTYGNLFRSLGIGVPVAADMSKNMVGLAADLASFNNASPEDVLAALQSGLVGEVEPLRKFGVSLNQSRIEAEALALGLVKPVAASEEIATAALKVEKAHAAAAKAAKEHGEESLEYRDATDKVAQAEAGLADATRGKVPELDAAAKTQAAYSLIMKDTALAQGDFARTAEGAANQQRILKAEWENAKASLGTALLPLFQDLLPIVISLVDAFSGLPPELQAIIVLGGGAAATFGPMISGVGNLASAASKFVDTGGGGITSFLGAAGPWVAVAALAAGAIYGISTALADQRYQSDLTIAKLEELSNKQLVAGIQKMIEFGQKTGDTAFINREFNRILEQSPVQALRFIDAAKEAGLETERWQQKTENHIQKEKEAQDETQRYTDRVNGLKDSMDRVPTVISTRFEVSGVPGGVSLGDIGAMGSGGIVTRPTVALIGEAGPEAVIPLGSSSAGMGSTYNINVTVAAGVSPAEVGAATVDAIRQYERVAGRAWRA